MKTSSLFTIALSIASVALSAQENTKRTDSPAAQTDPCAALVTQMEMNRCGQEQYLKTDSRLNSIYARIRKNLQSKRTDLLNLRAAQRAWIQYRDLHCTAARKQYEGGSISPLIFSTCMKETTIHRIEELKHTYATGDHKLE